MSRHQANVHVEVPVPDRLSTVVEEAALRAMTQLVSQRPAAVTIVLTGDDEIRMLNRTFRGYDDVTDVLSFENDDTPARRGPVYLGDIAISVPQAQRQAHAGGHPLEAEIQLLTIHGLLHLRGYDHADQTGKAEMWRIQAELLASLDAPISGPAFE